MIIRRILFVLFVFVIQREVFAQTLDPYRRINDPLAIADLGGPDSAAMMFAYKAGVDSIQAYATGPGIIRSFWMVYIVGADPDTDYMSLWVDDSLLFTGSIKDFFNLQHGLIGSPFDTSSGGAEVCETQIPFHRYFAWTCRGDWHWNGAAWQPIDTTKTSLPNLGSSSLETDQMDANSNYWNTNRFPNATEQTIDLNLSPGDTAVVANLPGPAYIGRIHLLIPPVDTELLSNLWVNIYWDYSPEPSVSIPLSDLFGQYTGSKDIHAIFISVDTANGSYDLTFPMPFKVNARITISNESESPVNVRGVIAYQDTTWKSSWAYFGTQYHVTTDIAYSLHHPVLHVKGHGRFIGTILSFPNPPAWPSYLEGDGYIVVDSTPFGFPSISTDYGGVEDYCDAGWYFFGPIDTVPSMLHFTLPFRGCPQWPYTVYRFHVNAPYNYTKSMDVDFGHGFNDDYTTTMHTTSFYYKQWTPFYPSSDTIIAGNTWKITGAGFTPDATIIAALDTDTIYRGNAASDGTISIKLNVPSSWVIGNHVLSINGIEKPEWITILKAPKLLYLQDSASPIFSEYDSINVHAYGFKPGEHLTLHLGDSLFTQTPTLIADSDGIVRLKTFLPWVPQGIYHLNVIRTDGTTVSSDSSFFVTRTLNYEFELLPNPGGGATYSYLSYSGRHWSQGAIDFCSGNYKRGSTFTFQFVVPFADTFSTTVFGTIGNRYAIYRTYIDGTDMGLHDWFWDVPWGTIARDSTILPNIYLTAGMHTMKFVNEGWDDSAVEYSIAPDNFLLRPISAQSGSQESVTPVPATYPLSIFPNPLDGQTLSISGIPDSVDTISVGLYNEVGQEVFQTELAQQIGIRIFNVAPVSNGSYWLSLSLPTGMKFIHLNILR